MKLIYLLWKAPYRYARIDSKEKHELVGVFETKRKASSRGRQIMKVNPESLGDHQWYWVEEREIDKSDGGQRVWPKVDWKTEVNFAGPFKPWTESEIEAAKEKMHEGEGEIDTLYAKFFSGIAQV